MERRTAPFGRLPITALFKPMIRNITEHHVLRSKVRAKEDTQPISHSTAYPWVLSTVACPKRQMSTFLGCLPTKRDEISFVQRTIQGPTSLHPCRN